MAMEVGGEDIKDSSLMGTSDGEVLCTLVHGPLGQVTGGSPRRQAMGLGWECIGPA